MARERAGKYGYHEFQIEAEFSPGSLLAAFLTSVGLQGRVGSHSHNHKNGGECELDPCYTHTCTHTPTIWLSAQILIQVCI